MRRFFASPKSMLDLRWFIGLRKTKLATNLWRIYPTEVCNLDLMANLNKPLVSVTRIEQDIALITIDTPGSSANIIDDQLFDQLDRTMERLMAQDNLAGVILYSAKPRIFVAGADLKKIVATADWPDSKVHQFCSRGRAVMARFSRCPFVSVAAVGGACVGGGLELALWCDALVATDEPRTKLGLPEVKLGLVPGWAGTARLPRIAGFENAADLITSGRLVSATEAKSMGFVEEVVPKDELIKRSVEIIGAQQESRAFVDRRRAIMGSVANINSTDDPMVQQVVSEMGKRIVANRNKVYPYAPTVVLEHLARTASLPIKEAWESESQAMAQVYGSPASRGLLNHFFLLDRNKKHPGLVDLELTPGKISRVGIVGAGLMGRSIAENCLKRGVSVVILDAQAGLTEAVVEELSNSYPESDIATAQDYGSFSPVDLVVESVVETLDVKRIVLGKIEAAVEPGTLIATNTSAIPIEKMAAELQRPEHFCGIHFCHPELMSLVEVVCGRQTDEQTIATAVGLVRQLAKMPVAINDCAGFVVNRLLAAMIDQSVRLFTMGISIEEIDAAMRDFGFLGGPFEIIDVIGVDTCMYAGRTMWESGMRCVTLSPILPKLMKSKRLGRKSGAGFYDYPDARGDRVWNPDLMDLIAQYREDSPSESTQQIVEALKNDPDQIAHQILAAITLEATNILEEEIVADPRDIGLCIIHGFSFPKHHGGILFWASQVGLKEIVKTLSEVSEIDASMKPTELLRTMSQKARTFY